MQQSHLAPVSIKRHFARLPDPRRRRRRVQHPLINLVVMALCATIAGADDWVEIAHFARQRRRWFAKFLNVVHGTPSHDTFQRVFSALDPIAFQQCLLAWVTALHEVTAGQIIAIDGKVAREAMARATDKGPLCLVSAWATANHVVLGQVAAPAGSSELGAVPELLRLLEVHGAIVTLDALGCQKEIVGQIVAQGGDYVISVKGNQEKLQAAVQETFGQAFDSPELAQQWRLRTWKQHEHKHGRQEERHCTVLEVPDDFPERDQWPRLRSIAMMLREYQGKNGEKCLGVRYYISSLPAKARTIARAVRGHWSIENQLAWVMDVCFREDRSRARAQHEQANLGVLRRTALSLIKNTNGLQGGVNCRRKQAGWNAEVLERILFGSQETQN